MDSKDSREYGPAATALLLGRVIHKFWFKPLHFKRIDEVLPSQLQDTSPAAYYVKSYNLTQTDRLQLNDWVFLLKVLQDDRRCEKLGEDERSNLTNLVVENLRKLNYPGLSLYQAANS